MTHNWFPSSGVLQMHLPESADVDIRVNGNTYSAGTFNLIDFQQCTAALNSNTLAVTPSHTTYNAGDGLSLYFGTFANVAKAPNVRLDGTLYSPTQINEIVYDSISFSHSLSGTQLTLSTANSVSTTYEFYTDAQSYLTKSGNWTAATQ